ncbi:MAG: hypothetical protein KG003_04470 [Bacteroidetes bacterium]|nr:hypothetical protein [Bacteroidota bacterium]
MTNKNTITAIVIGLMLITAGFLAITSKKSPKVEKPLVTNFEECKNAGYPVMESYPEQCRDAEGNLFVQIVEDKTVDNTEDVPTPVSYDKEFNKPITFKINNQATFSGNITITLKEINDSRCKPDVQCIWAGELSALFSVLFPTINPAQDVRLGTTNNKSVTMHGYTFTLQSGTEDTVTIIVSPKTATTISQCYVGGCSAEVCSDQKDVASNCIYKEEFMCYKTAKCEIQKTGQCGWTETSALSMCLKNASSRIAGGYITGHVTLSPLCPVEPCKPNPEAYTSREVVVYTSDKVTVKERIHLDSQGNYNVAIGPGSYFVQIVPAGIGPGEKKSATVKSFETTTVNFDIDTGIR